MPSPERHIAELINPKVSLRAITKLLPELATMQVKISRLSSSKTQNTITPLQIFSIKH